MAKRTGLGENQPWIRNTRNETTASTESPPETTPPPKKQAPARKHQASQKPKVEAQQAETGKNTPEVQQSETSEVPKFETFEVKLSILLREDQLEFLERMTREIMGNRDRDSRRERITKNTVVRACLDVLRGVEIDTANVPDEEELGRRIREGLGKFGS
jgi:hypothetical protein